MATYNYYEKRMTSKIDEAYFKLSACQSNFDRQMRFMSLIGKKQSILLQINYIGRDLDRISREIKREYANFVDATGGTETIELNYVRLLMEIAQFDAEINNVINPDNTLGI